MADLRLPAALQAGIEALAGQGRAVADRAAALSAAYRAERPSAIAVTDAADIGAYLVTRVPATYAAVRRVLDEMVSRLSGFEPASLLDAGAGPGTASWAAVDAFDSLAAITMLDHNRGLLAAADELAQASGRPALASSRRIAGSLTAAPLGDQQFDLITLSYALTELPDRQIVEAALGLWHRAAGAFVIVEPGRPRDYQRLMAVRAALIAAGATIVAPCPHDLACPLQAPDWCHFSVRLQRSRAHMQAKGGSLGYEDEKFSYIVAVRPGLAGNHARARVLRPPAVRKFEVEMALCTPTGLETRIVPKRDPAAFKMARKLDWGDALE